MSKLSRLSVRFRFFSEEKKCDRAILAKPARVVPLYCRLLFLKCAIFCESWFVYAWYVYNYRFSSCLTVFIEDRSKTHSELNLAWLIYVPIVMYCLPTSWNVNWSLVTIRFFQQDFREIGQVAGKGYSGAISKCLEGSELIEFKLLRYKGVHVMRDVFIGDDDWDTHVLLLTDFLVIQKPLPSWFEFK